MSFVGGGGVCCGLFVARNAPKPHHLGSGRKFPILWYFWFLQQQRDPLFNIGLEDLDKDSTKNFLASNILLHQKPTYLEFLNYSPFVSSAIYNIQNMQLQ